MVKSLPAKQETWIQSLDSEEPLEKEMATNASILAWAIPCIEELGGLPSMGSRESDMTEHAPPPPNLYLFIFYCTTWFPDQGGLNQYPLHCKADSSPLDQQESP